MTAALYTRYEVLRAFRSTRFFAFSLGFPLVMYYLFAGPNRDVELDGISFALARLHCHFERSRDLADQVDFLG